MTDQFDLVLVEDGEGKTEPAYAEPFTVVQGDLAQVDGELYEVKAVVENVSKAAIELLKETGAAMMIEKVYTLAWDAKKGAVNNA